MGQIISNIDDINFINKYFYDIATDAVYDRLEVTKFLFNDLALDSAKFKCIEDFEVQRTLAGVCMTSSVDDSMLSCGLFKHCSYALALIVSHIVICRYLLAGLPKHGIMISYHQFPNLVLLKMSPTSNCNPHIIQVE